MTDEEWNALRDCEVVLSVSYRFLSDNDFLTPLKIPHAVQTMMCAERTPTLMLVIPAFEMFMTRMEDLLKANPHLEPMIKACLEVAYKYYNRLDCSTAYKIANCKYRSLIIASPNATIF
jgi:hypothetical protein